MSTGVWDVREPSPSLMPASADELAGLAARLDADAPRITPILTFPHQGGRD